jgi:hypothetical protein
MIPPRIPSTDVSDGESPPEKHTVGRRGALIGNGGVLEMAERRLEASVGGIGRMRLSGRDFGLRDHGDSR